MRLLPLPPRILHNIWDPSFLTRNQIQVLCIGNTVLITGQPGESQTHSFKKGKFVFLSCYYCSAAQSCMTLCNPMDYSTASIPVLHCLPEFAQTQSIGSNILSNHLILCHPLLFLPLIFPSIRVFFNKLAVCIRWLKYWSFSFNISPSNEQSGLISFRIDWFDILAVQETLKSLLPHHSSKTSILQHSAFFMVHLSHLYMTTRKTIALTIQTFVSK